MNQFQNNGKTKKQDSDSKLQERTEKRKGKGANAYIGVELIEVIERFQEISDYNTFRKASSELGKILKEDNSLLRQPEQGEQGWGGEYFSMENTE